MIRFKTQSAVLTAAGVVAFTTAAHAAVITIDNASFENPDIPAGDTFENVKTTLADWDESGGAGMFTLDATLAGVPAVPDGDQWLQINDAANGNAAIEQQVGTLDTTLIYTLELTVGDRDLGDGDTDFDFGLWADSDGTAGLDFGSDTALALGTQADVSSVDFTNTTPESEVVTVTFDASTLPALDGDNLYVALRNNNDPTTPDGVSVVLFDDVSLTTEVIPEPASMALMALGGLLMYGRRHSA